MKLRRTISFYLFALIQIIALSGVCSAADQPTIFDEVKLANGNVVKGIITSKVPVFDDSNAPQSAYVTIEVHNGKSVAKLRFDVTDVVKIRYRGDVLLEKAQAEFDNKQIEQSFQTLQQLEVLVPLWRPGSDLRLKVGMKWGQLLADSGKADRAAFVFKEVRRYFPGDTALRSRYITAVSQVANSAYDNGDFLSFQRSLAEIEVIEPNSPRVLALKKRLNEDFNKAMTAGNEAQKKGDPRVALEHFERAYRMRPNASELRAILVELRKTFKRFSYGEPTRILGFDPVIHSSPADRRLQQFLFTGLVRHIRDPRALVETSYLVDLARTIRPSPDGRSLYIALRQPLFWSNGERVLARDVLATIQAMCAEDSVARDASFARTIDLAKTRERGSAKARIGLRFSSPRPRMLLDFAIMPARMLGEPPRIRKQGQMNLKPVGTGPFRFDERRGNSVVLTPNPYFVPPGQTEPKPAQLGEVRMTSFSDPTTARARLENRQIDLLTELHPADVVRLQANGRFKIRHLPQRKVTFLAFNHRRAHFQKRTGYFLRKAINLAVNKSKLLVEHYQSNTGFSGAHKVLSGPFPRESWAYNNDVKPYKYDLDLARQTMRQTQTKNLTLRLIHPPDPIITTICAVMKKQIQDAGAANGLRIRLVKLTPALFQKAIERRSFDLAYCSYNFDRPVLDLEPILGDSETGENGRNYMGYRHPDLAKLFNLLRATDLWTKIRALNQGIHKHLHENAVIVPLWQLDTYFAHSKDLDQFEIHPVHLFGAPWKLTVR